MRSSLVNNKNIKDPGIIAVLDFENFADYVNAGEITAEFTRTELLARNFKVCSKNEFLKLCKTAGIDINTSIKEKNLSEIMEKTGVNTIICGSVAEYRYKYGLGEAPAVSFNLQALDCATNSIIWQTSGSRSTGRFFLIEYSLSELAQKTIKKIIEGYSAATGRK